MSAVQEAFGHFYNKLGGAMTTEHPDPGEPLTFEHIQNAIAHLRDQATLPPVLEDNCPCLTCRRRRLLIREYQTRRREGP